MRTIARRIKGDAHGRKHRIQYAAQLLRHAVNECAADPRWEPPSNLKPFVGSKPKGTTLTTFAKDDQIVRLLEGIDNPQWRKTAGLMGHSLLTQSRHYGSQIDQEILDTAHIQALIGSAFQ